MKHLKNGFGLALGVVVSAVLGMVALGLSAALWANHPVLALVVGAGFVWALNAFTKWVVDWTCGSVAELESKLATERAENDAAIERLRDEAVESIREQGKVLRQRFFNQGYDAGRNAAIAEAVKAYADPHRVDVDVEDIEAPEVTEADEDHPLS